MPTNPPSNSQHLAMSKPFDYSKWDNIELSDDESDCHPNIEKESWFRMKHRSRVEREETEEAVLEMIKEMTNKIKVEIEEEHKEREENFETLLNLLEDK